MRRRVAGRESLKVFREVLCALVAILGLVLETTFNDPSQICV